MSHVNLVLYHYPFTKQLIGRMKRKREKIYIQIEQAGNTQTKNRELADEWSRLKILTETVLNFRFKETILNR